MPCRPIYMASVAAMGVKFAKRIRQPFTAPTTTARMNIRANPSAMVCGDWPSLMKNDATTTRNPAKGPTDRSIPPISKATVCPSAMKPSAVASNRMFEMLKADR